MNSDIAWIIAKYACDIKIEGTDLYAHNNDYTLKIITERVNNGSEIMRCLWNYLATNEHPDAIKILKNNLDKINPVYLLANNNSKAFELYKPIIFTPNNVLVTLLCNNNNDFALDIIEENIDIINWKNLSKNSNKRAIKLLLKNPEKIDRQNVELFNKNAHELKLTYKPRTLEYYSDNWHMHEIWIKLTE